MKLFCSKRISKTASSSGDARNEFDKDYDRILFSAPIRRLANKTQVFPLETNDSVRTRLTHSHEVSNLCRSLTLQILRQDSNTNPFGDEKQAKEEVPVIAAAAGLVHDLGNPPFGHKGEEALRNWFKQKKTLFTVRENSLSEAQENDLLKWESNAQTLRLVTKLQVSKGKCGLNLTNATLAALMKYTVGSDKVNKKDHPAKKKFGYFDDDSEVASKILENVGLESGQRHVVAYIMEACDDIAYSTIDVEDAISKGLVSLNDVLACMERCEGASEKVANNVKTIIDKLNEENRSAEDIKDIACQYFRSNAITEMILAARNAYLKNKDDILRGRFNKSILEASTASDMYKKLKDFAFKNAFQSQTVTELELHGSNVLHELMDYFWQGISECSLKKCKNISEEKIKDLEDELESPDVTMFGQFSYNKISSNYREIFESSISKECSSVDVRYKQMLLLTDMVSGMTEDFVIDTHKQLKRLKPCLIT